MPQKNITIIATLTSALQGSDRMMELLKKLVAETRLEPGCIRYDMHIELKNPNVYVIYEVWRDFDAHENHKHTKHFTNFLSDSATILDHIDIVELSKVEL